MRTVLRCAMGLWIAAQTPTVQAHHSLAGVYDSTRTATIEAVVSEFRFINPHPLVIVDVIDEEGRESSWTLEMDNRRELAEIGFDAGTLAPGDRVVVTGSLARNDARRLYIRRLDRPRDGLHYRQVGSRPELRRN